MSFRIAGIKILPNCAPYIRKVLKEGEVYLFSSRYKINLMDELSLSFDQAISDNLFAQWMYNVNQDSHTLEVTVNAIVGQNGDGKSSLLEVMLRIMNNFAYHFGFLEDQPTLKYVGGVHAILYYEIDKKIYAIKCEDKKISWYKNGVKLMVNGTDEKKKRFIKDHYVPDLFYEMVINYSLYAYTPASLGGDRTGEGYWIDGLFHKNDSYQTPIVLNPMRTNGNIDVIREEYLSKQRLISIFANSKGDDKVRMVSNNEKAVGYAFSLERESKFLKKTLNNYFLEKFHDEVVWDDIFTYEHSDDKVPDYIVQGFRDFWGAFRFELEANPRLIKECSLSLSNQSRPRKTDLRRFLTLINNTLYPINPKTKRRENGGFGREFSLLASSKGYLSKLNYRQFYRLLLILLIWRALTETNEFAMKDERLDDVLAEPNAPRNAAKLYLVYKFISIAETYKGFCNAYYLYEDSYTPLIREWPNKDAIGTIRQDLKLIMRTNDYRTLKFKQTISYLKKASEFYDASPCTFNNISFDYFLSFDSLCNTLANVPLKEIQWRLPCPVFEGDIILHDGKEYYPLDTLSSGMIQRLNTVGSLIYHLRNLDDEQKGDAMIAYNNVCVVLEEVELYYHPEYQKSYLNYLLEQISRAGLRRLKSLNLMFVTHSPFILSDIIRTDILCLEGGIQKDLSFKTFGANIHDLLRHPFFMKNGTIGDFSQNIINRIIVSLAIYDAIKKAGNQSFEWNAFKQENKDLIEYGDFLPYNNDGSLDIMNFEVQYSQRMLGEAISLIDEPIVKDALTREYKRIF